MQKLSAFQLKMFMAILMVLDHLPNIPGFIPPNLALFFHVITRCVGVWFAYMAVEGFIHTSNKIKYNALLALWAIFMLLGNLIFKVSNNIFLTLAMGVLVLNLLFNQQSKTMIIKILRIVLAAIIAFIALFFTEGGIVIIPFMFITYALRHKHLWRNIAYLIFSIFLFSSSFVVYETLSMTINMLALNSDFMFITVLPFIYLYNGKRGLNNNFSKYFFYVFYPAHLWIIALIAMMMAPK